MPWKVAAVYQQYILVNKVWGLLYTFLTSQENPYKRQGNSNCILNLIHFSLLVWLCVFLIKNWFYINLYYINIFLYICKLGQDNKCSWNCTVFMPRCVR